MSLKNFERISFLCTVCCFCGVWYNYGNILDKDFFNWCFVSVILLELYFMVCFRDRYITSLNKLKKNYRFNYNVSYKLVHGLLKKRLYVRIENDTNGYNFWNRLDCSLLNINEDSLTNEKVIELAKKHPTVVPLHSVMNYNYLYEDDKRFDHDKLVGSMIFYKLIGLLFLVIYSLLFYYNNINKIESYWNNGEYSTEVMHNSDNDYYTSF